MTDERFLKLMMRVRKLSLDTNVLEIDAVTPAQITVLDWIAATPGCGVQEVADGLGLTPPTVSVGVRKMEENGLVERKPNPSDKRSVQLFLTERGQAIQEKIQSAHRRKFQHLLAGLTAQEQETLLQLLERALQSAESNSGNPNNHSNE